LRCGNVACGIIRLDRLLTATSAQISGSSAVLVDRVEPFFAQSLPCPVRSLPGCTGSRVCDSGAGAGLVPEELIGLVRGLPLELVGDLVLAAGGGLVSLDCPALRLDGAFEGGLGLTGARLPTHTISVARQTAHR
jgi:hypothetical protein